MKSKLKKAFEMFDQLPKEEQDAFADLIGILFENYLSTNQELSTIIQIATDHYQRMADIGLFTNKIIGPYTDSLLVRSKKNIYAVDPDDFGVGLGLRMHGDYGTEQLQYYQKYIQPEYNVLVVGAHIGTLAIPLSEKCNKIVAIEANPRSYQLLQLNIYLNNIGNCELYNIAANDKTEPLPFYANKANSGGSKRKPLHDQYIYHYDKPEIITVPGIPLDDILNPIFDIIIMDIEGSEYFALMGMQRVLSQSKVLILEFVPHHLNNVSGVTVNEFLSVLPNYDSLTVPSLNRKVGPAEYSDLLNYMANNNLNDDGIIFEKLATQS